MRVVVGARSALFLPFANLGLIVVDEEHDGSFKQDDGVAYNARDMAVVRARLVSAPIVLASATPSLESVVNVASGRYGAAAPAGPPRRPGAGEAVGDRSAARAPARGRWLSPPVVEAMKQTLAAGEQTLLFLNRRGYAPAHPVPRLRPRHRMPAMLGLAGRAPLSPHADLPSLRPHRAAGRVPASIAAPSTVRRLRARRRAPGRGGAANCFPRRGWNSSPRTA